MVIRDLRWEDFDDLIACYYLLYDERAAGEPVGITLFAERPTLDDEVHWFTETYRRVVDGGSVGAVAEVDGHAVGSCFVTRLGPNDRSELAHVGELGLLVHRDHRGHGIGAALLRETIARCRGRFERIRLAVFSTNEPAKRLYRTMGFTTFGVEPRAVKRGDRYFDVDWMTLAL